MTRHGTILYYALWLFDEPIQCKLEWQEVALALREVEFPVTDGMAYAAHKKYWLLNPFYDPEVS